MSAEGIRAEAAHEPHAERELTIDLRPYGWRRWVFEGTRAQLEAEGAIPPGTEWPATGARWVEWKAGPLEFRLCRTRPPGLKGPMRLWINGDWWGLVCTPVKDEPLQWKVLQAQRELERLRRLQTPEGQRAARALSDRHWKARTDKRFRAFLSLFPELNPPRRGRRAGGAAG